MCRWMIRRSSRRSTRYFDPLIGRPSTPVECHLRLMSLKFRYRLGYEPVRRGGRLDHVAAVAGSRTMGGCRIRRRCEADLPRGEKAVAGMNEALWGKASVAKLRARRMRADITLISANVTYPTDSGLLAKAVDQLPQARLRLGPHPPRRRQGAAIWFGHGSSPTT